MGRARRSRPTLATHGLTDGPHWDIQVATVGVTPLAPAIRVGSRLKAFSHARFRLAGRSSGLPWTCPFEGYPEPTDLNVPLMLACELAGRGQWLSEAR